MKLNVYYDSETDTLSLWNGKPAGEGADVAENLTADLDAEGEVVGFTLEHAADTLKAVGAHPSPAWGGEGLTPDGIAKRRIRSAAWNTEDLQKVSEKT